MADRAVRSGVMLHRANLNLRGIAHGEIVDIDPDDWSREIDAGFLVPVEGDDGDEEQPRFVGELPDVVRDAIDDANAQAADAAAEHDQRDAGASD